MKILKKLFLAGLFLASSSSSVFAGTLFDSSAGTIHDETSTIYDYIDWNHNDFDGGLLSFKLDGTQTLNGQFANRNDNGKQVGVSIDTGFTSETFFPKIRVMHGFRNIGLLWQLDINKINEEVTAPTIGFGGGINFNNKFGFGLFFNMYGYTVRRIPVEYDKEGRTTRTKSEAIYYPTLQLDGMIRFRDNDKASDNIKFHINAFGAYLESNTTPYTEIKINPIVSYNLNVALTDNIVYGFKPEYSLLIGAGTLTTKTEGQPDIKTINTSIALRLTLNNGITGSLFNDKILVSAGLKTNIMDISSLISVNKTAEDKEISGTKTSIDNVQFFTNTVTVGGALYVTENFHIDCNTVVDVANGVSLEDIFKQKWSLSITALF